MPGAIHLSVSTWQQPLPRPRSDERSALVAEVAERIVALGDGRHRVGIDGLTGAGKTSFGHELAVQIAKSGRPVLRASLDDFKRPWSERHLYDRESGEGYYRNAFDYAAVARLLLEPAGADGSGQCVLCSIDPLTQVDHSHVVTAAPQDAVLLVDGVFAFRPEINEYWEFRIWLAVGEDESVRRGGERDRARGGAEAERVHRDRYLVAERIYIQEADPIRAADVVVDNADLDHPRIVRA
jgi:uridine kinase